MYYSVLHTCHALLSRYGQQMNNFSEIRVVWQIYSHCLKKDKCCKFSEISGPWTSIWESTFSFPNLIMSHQFFTQPVWKDNMYCLMPPSIASSGELTLTEFLNACWTTFCLPWYLINSTHQLVSKFWHIFALKAPKT